MTTRRGEKIKSIIKEKQHVTILRCFTNNDGLHQFCCLVYWHSSIFCWIRK